MISIMLPTEGVEQGNSIFQCFRKSGSRWEHLQGDMITGKLPKVTEKCFCTLHMRSDQQKMGVLSYTRR